MATGAPDWQGLRWKVESTNRLNQLYPTGKVILSDDFSEPNLGWQLTAAGVSTLKLVTTPTYTPPNCAKLTNAESTNAEAYMRKWVGVPTANKIGIELAYSKVTAEDIRMFIRVNVYDGASNLVAAVRHWNSTGYWEYYDSAGAWQKVAGADETVRLGADTFHRAKMAVDLEEKTYLLLRSNQNAYDMRGYAIYETASSLDPVAEVAIGTTRPAVGGTILYVDNATITEE